MLTPNGSPGRGPLRRHFGTLFRRHRHGEERRGTRRELRDGGAAGEQIGYEGDDDPEKAEHRHDDQPPRGVNVPARQVRKTLDDDTEERRQREGLYRAVTRRLGGDPAGLLLPELPV